MFGRTFERPLMSDNSIWLGGFLLDWRLCLQFRMRVHNMVSDLTPLKAGLVANPYTKKQNNYGIYKRINERDYWYLERCPFVSADVRLCRDLMAEFLTKIFINSFVGICSRCEYPFFSDVSSQKFSLSVRFYAGFFVNLGKHCGKASHFQPWTGRSVQFVMITGHHQQLAFCLIVWRMSTWT